MLFFTSNEYAYAGLRVDKNMNQYYYIDKIKAKSSLRSSGKDQRVNITVCIGSSCHLKGSRAVVEQLERLILERGLKGEIELRGSFCMGQCQTGVSVLVDETYYSLTPEDTERFFIQSVLPKLAHTKHATETQIEPV